MTWPNVTVNQVNQLLGETNEVERAVLFIGTGTKNAGKTLAVNAQSDFDALLGEDASPLKNDVLAAVPNAGQNWWGFVHVLADDAEPGAWVDAVKAAQVSCSVEGVVLSDDVATKTEINQAATLRAELMAKYGRWVWFLLATQGIQEGESQADYLARLSTLQEGINVAQLMLDTLDVVKQLAEQTAGHTHSNTGTPTNAAEIRDVGTQADTLTGKYSPVIGR